MGLKCDPENIYVFYLWTIFLTIKKEIFMGLILGLDVYGLFSNVFLILKP